MDLQHLLRPPPAGSAPPPDSNDIAGVVLEAWPSRATETNRCWAVATVDRPLTLTARSDLLVTFGDGIERRSFGEERASRHGAKARSLTTVAPSTVQDMSAEWAPLEFVRDSNEADEPMGSKEKWWVEVPPDERQWLLKLSRIDVRDGIISGEDWAEWVVHRLAALLEIPTATVRPANLEVRRRIVSRSVIQDRLEYLDHGNSVLSAQFPDYDQSVHGENAGYTPTAVRDALLTVEPPRELTWPSNFTAFDVWAGYLVMDAWVAGRDRHHENWAVVLRGQERRLAPSFDHGNALGFQERDERRARMIQDDAHLLRWVERGVSQHFAGRPSLTDLAWSALDLTSAGTATYWLDRLDAVSEEAANAAVSGVPDAVMSEVTRTFVSRLLKTNRRRLLDGYSGA